MKEEGKNQLVDIKISTLKRKQKKTLLEEIVGVGDFGGSDNRPIIIVPPSAQPGNLCLLNAIPFLKEGQFKNGEEL